MIVGLLLGGRTTSVILLFLPFLYLVRNRIKYLLLLTALIYFSLGFILPKITDFLSLYFEDINSRQFRLGPREYHYLSIFDALEWKDYVFGFNIDSTLYLPFSQYGDYRTESSFIQLIAFSGILSIPIILYITWYWIKSGVLWLLIIIYFRSLTGDFYFYSVYDWILIYPIFQYQLIMENKYLFPIKLRS